MLTVRFPTGVSVRYNQATFIQYGPDIWHLYTKDPKAEGSRFVAAISPYSGAIVEALPACAVENPTAGLTGEKALDYVIDNIRQFNGYPDRRKLKRLKAKLGDYNATRGEWREKQEAYE